MAQNPPYRIDGELPRTLHAGTSAEQRSVERLCDWLRAESARIGGWLRQHGALRFRGFDVQGPAEFEAIARAIDPGLGRHYLGTSPRNAVSDYVFNASELPDFYPIPQHCEMSFCASPPRHLFFCCLVEPAEGSGETPLCDFRRVWQDLDPALRERFVAGGLRIVRNYAPESAGRADDPTMLKPWTEMFGTKDRAEVERQCRAEGFEVEWRDDDSLRLVSTQPVFRDHPETGERAWHNHLTTFHLSTAVSEYERIARLRPSERHQNLLKLARALEARLRERPSLEQSMHVTRLDGSEIPAADIEALRDAIWRHTVIEPWRRGDVVAIDNFAVAHGRMPYEGPRKVVVAWA